VCACCRLLAVLSWLWSVRLLPPAGYAVVGALPRPLLVVPLSSSMDAATKQMQGPLLISLKQSRSDPKRGPRPNDLESRGQPHAGFFFGVGFHYRPMRFFLLPGYFFGAWGLGIADRPTACRAPPTTTCLRLASPSAVEAGRARSRGWGGWGGGVRARCVCRGAGRSSWRGTGWGGGGPAGVAGDAEEHQDTNIACVIYRRRTEDGSSARYRVDQRGNQTKRKGNTATRVMACTTRPGRACPGPRHTRKRGLPSVPSHCIPRGRCTHCHFLRAGNIH
jgi:hypothetical protein